MTFTHRHINIYFHIYMSFTSLTLSYPILPVSASTPLQILNAPPIIITDI